MMRYLFVLIPSLLFEPIAICALTGCIAAFLPFPKKRNPLFSSIAVAICIFLAWRLAVHSIMLSSRYAAIILYPAIIISTWVCFRLIEYLQLPNSKRYFKPYCDLAYYKKICAVIPFIMVAVLVILSLIKTLRYKHYANHMVKICQVLKNESRGKDIFVYAQDSLGSPRIAYYSGIDEKNILSSPREKDMPICQFLNQQLVSFKNLLWDVYFIFYLEKDEIEPEPQRLMISQSIGKWEYIHREYTSRRKNRELVMYRFIPAHPNIEIWEKDIPGLSPDNLCKNGNFEQVLSSKKLEARLGYYKKIGASDFYLMQGRFFPTHWWLSVSKPINGQSSEMALTEKRPIAGKYSLELESRGYDGWGVNSNFIPKQDCIFSGFIRAESKSTVEIHTCYWNTDIKKTIYIDTFLFRLQPGKNYRFSVPVRRADVPKKDESIFLSITGHGHILLDNVECIRTQKTTGMEQKQ